jgi:rubrerythrin
MKTREEWLEQLPIGWRIAFGNQLADDVIALTKKYNFENEYEVLQIKEKFGGLRWYAGHVPQEMYAEHSDLIKKYEEMSYYICVICGRPAKAPQTMFDQPICDECRDNLKTKKL